MRGLIGFIGDRLQAAFPPNRLAILLAGPILAASAWISGLVAANIPGVNLPVGVIAGVMGVAVLIVARLLDRWFDQWQKGEPIHVEHDLDQALDELADSPATHAFYTALGTMQAVDHAIADLHGRIGDGVINEAEIAKRLESLSGVISDFVKEHVEPDAVPSPPAAAVPPAVAAPPVAAPPGAPAGPPANVE